MIVQKFKKIMRATQGALIVASTIQIVLGFSGLWRNVARFVCITKLICLYLVSSMLTLFVLDTAHNQQVCCINLVIKFYSNISM